LFNPPERKPECLVPGRVEGLLVGGNLSLLAATVGTPWQIDATDRILFLEDIDEAPYRIDRMLTQMRLAGILDSCAGFLLGDWKNCTAAPGKKSLDLSEVFRDILPAGKPVLANLAAGHCTSKLTLPLGVMVRIDSSAHLLEYLEPATC
ncbi:MAG: LD-carboxypeptidase, partial [Nitrospirota bacterium]|nr:LD-carboxypeptidase [Nitrospirota bacterium]